MNSAASEPLARFVMFTTFITSGPSDPARDYACRNGRIPAQGANQCGPVIVPQPGLCVTLAAYNRLPATAR
jgi:hypothetical protein